MLIAWRSITVAVSPTILKMKSALAQIKQCTAIMAIDSLDASGGKIAKGSALVPYGQRIPHHING